MRNPSAVSGTAAPALTHFSPRYRIQMPSLLVGRPILTKVWRFGTARGAAGTSPDVPAGDGTPVPDVPTADSGVYAPIAPMVAGGAVGAAAACGNVPLEAVAWTGNEGVRLPVVPARLPCRGRSYGCIM